MVFQGNQMISGKGPQREFAKLLLSILMLANTPTDQTDFPPEVIQAFLDANDQIIAIREIAKTYDPWNDDADKVKNAKKYLADNPGELPYINPRKIDERWFDAVTGLRAARYSTLPYAALQKKINIKGSPATKILEAKLNNSPIPQVRFRPI